MPLSTPSRAFSASPAIYIWVMKRSMPSPRDREMDMRGTAAIGHRSDRPERIGAVLAAHRAAVALEILVAPLGLPGRVDMVVMAVDVALPDLDARAADRAAGRVEQPARHMGDLALRRARPARHGDEVVVDIVGEADRIEGPGGLARPSRPGGRRRTRAGAAGPGWWRARRRHAAAAGG